MTLGPFPVDDATLLAVEHALGARHVVEADGTHVRVGADYGLAQLLDFLSGTPAAQEADGMLEYDDGWPLYTERDVIRALIAEVRRLRG